MLGRCIAAILTGMILLAVSFTLVVSPSTAQVTPSPSVNASGGPLNINVQLPTVPPVRTPSSPSPSPVTVVEQRSGSGGVSSWLGVLASWLWLLLIVIIILLIIAIVIFLLTRGPPSYGYGPDDGYYEETRVTRRRRRY